MDISRSKASNKDSRGDIRVDSSRKSLGFTPEGLTEAKPDRAEQAPGRCLNSILFIDDNPLVLETVKKLMENTAFELLTSDDPFMGLCQLSQHKPIAAFIDASLNGLSGYQFCALIKAQPTYRHILIILVLEQADKLLAARAIAAGANSVLVKPFGRNELIEASRRPGEIAA
tara:strand:- start:115613 stop:116128 length:516 start_codon:yes stop_codon:yes gene_type:complete